MSAVRSIWHEHTLLHGTCHPAPLHNCDFFGAEVVEVVDEVIDLGFEGLDVGGGIGLLGGEDAVDERFDLLLLLINHRYKYQLMRCFFLCLTRSRYQGL